MKIKLYLFGLIVCFAFLFGQKADAQTYDECINDYGGTPEDCAGYPGDPMNMDDMNMDGVDENDYYNGDESDIVFTCEECMDSYSQAECVQYGYCNAADGIYDAGSYEDCVAYCQSIGDSGDCYMTCGEEYNATGDEGLGSGSGYECEEGYQEDPSDPTMCIPICEGNGQYYSDYYDSCVGGSGSSCFTDDDCGGGLDCNSSNSCESNIWGKISDTTTNWFEDRISEIDLKETIKTSGGTTIPAGSKVSSDGSVRLPSGAIMPSGTVSGNALNQLFPDLETSSGGVFGSLGDFFSGGSSNDGGGGYNNTGSGSGASYNFGSPGTTSGIAGAAGCGAGFEKIGGVCFPSKSVTGLSDAPIALIITNLFFWLMTLFTTLAVGAFVVSGIQYLTSAGDSSQAETAKKNATWATIGIIVGFSGFIIVKAIATALSGQATLF